MSDPSPNPPDKTTSSGTPAPRAPLQKPRISLAIATAFGLGYLPKAPGTWGSLAGVLIYSLVQYLLPIDVFPGARNHSMAIVATWSLMTCFPISFALAVVGVLSASRAAQFAGKKDPQFVVIDEVSGQHLAYSLSLTLLNWKYLLLGFILFRVFDIWKPFPARQAESLPGGLGIMADDWIAGIYAALGLWIARAAGL
jgi:phosphatidylglycerophosphatase A